MQILEIPVGTERVSPTTVLVPGPPEPSRIHALPNRLHELDGLRGGAALTVIGYHYLAGPAVYSHTAGRIQELLYVFPLSVDMFFILSGFLVGGILLGTKTSPNYFKTFYMRRLYRVAPIYYLWILGFIGLVLCLPKSGNDLAPKGYSSWAFLGSCLVFVQNFPRFPLFLTKAQWFGTTWSLALEEHFYLVVPFCLYRLSRRSLIAGLSAIIVLAPLARMFAWQVLNLKNPWGITYVWTPFRADALAIGVLLAILWESPEIKVFFRKQIIWIYFCFGATATVAIVLDYMKVKHVRYADALAVAFGRSALEAAGLSVILIALVFQGHKNVAIMRWSWAREFGKISYCTYLTHRGILWLVLLFGFHTKAGFGFRSDVLAGIIALILTTCLAALSWKYLEGPLQRRAHRFTY
ncbi:MAG: acyltransferase [Acidobacteriia bacterium]|nr:acyltransferase [Terriglobia bacterium]